jgi:lipid A disaccharide synthetase
MSQIKKDILILSNAPGELATWVYPVLRELGQRPELVNFRADFRISIVLSPCNHASGNEAETAKNFPNADRVLPPESFFDFLLWNQTPNWEWAKDGIVIFLGGDQIFPIAIGKRLGYKTLIYVEWEARWMGLGDRYALRNANLKVPEKYRHKATVVGDLMVDREGLELDPQIKQQNPKIVLMPGSKGMKLMQGVPIMLGAADFIKSKLPDFQFTIALAPTITPDKLAKYAEPNPVIDMVEGTTGELFYDEQTQQNYLKTPAGTEVEIYTKFPATDLFAECQICLTSIGANTAELAALGVPMLVILPTNQLDAMRGWDGVGGLLVNLPIIGAGFAKLINYFAIKSLLSLKNGRRKLLAWANIWADEEIVPELFGHLTSKQVGEILLELLEHPEKLTQMSDRLQAICGQRGAAKNIIDIVLDMVPEK